MKHLLSFLFHRKALAAQSEPSVFDLLDGGAMRRAAWWLESKKLWLFGIAAVGVIALISFLGNLIRNWIYRAALRREVKKELEPVNERLDELEEQNEELHRQNEELRELLVK